MNPSQLRAVRWDVRRLFVTTVLVAACASEAAVCISYPCGLFEAVRITVTGINAPIGVPGLAMAVSGSMLFSEPCTEGTNGTSICHINGGIGTYHVVLSAPGYQPMTLDFTTTGTPAGCSTCGHADLQQRSVVLQPTP